MKKLNCLLSLLVGILCLWSTDLQAQYCVSGCNDNTFINASDPNTIEYDNVVSLYHSTLLKEADGNYLVWGASASPDGEHNIADGQTWSGIPSGLGNNTTPATINAANGYNYSGTILKATGGSSNNIHAQFAILTTEGIYVWGRAGYLVSTGIKSTNAMGKITPSGANSTSLPDSVTPAEVKMFFGTYHTLGIVTCSGAAYVLSQTDRMAGDGTSTHDNAWHRVSTSTSVPLNNVVAMRGSTSGMMALTADGHVYTWGNNVYLAGSSNPNKADYTFANQMDLTAISGNVKMIGMTGGNSHYILTTDGKIYALGTNGSNQLGDWTTTERKNWVRVQKSSTAGDYLDNIVWLSPNEHASTANGGPGYAAVNVLTHDGKIWSWGSNSFDMLGGSGSSSINPSYMVGTSTGGLQPTDNLLAVETGGHTTMVIRQCSDKFGYIGHRVDGSMANGDNTNAAEPVFSFLTAPVNVCGALAGPAVQNLKICPGTTADLDNANLETPKSNIEWHVADDINSALVPNINSVGMGTYYAFFTAASGKCQNVSSSVTVSEYLPGDAGYGSCTLPIVAHNDYYSLPSGGGTTTPSILNNDTLGGAPATTSNVTTSITDHGTLPATGVTLNPDGTITVDGTVPDGYYTFTYQICQTGVSPVNCATALVGITVGEVCTEPVHGEDFNWNYPSGTHNNGDIISSNISEPASNYGFTFDIYELDNSFNMNINGTDIATGEIQFQQEGTPGINIEFADGTQYATNANAGTPGNTDEVIWNLNGTSDHPIIRVIISPVGTISLYGSKTDGGPLFPLKFKTGVSNAITMNNITWNTTGTNSITVKQTVIGATNMQGLGYGNNIVPCVCFVDPATTGSGPATKVGITTLKRAGADNGNWPMIRLSGHVALESNTKGFVITRTTTAELEAIKAAGHAEEGMMSYDTDKKCLSIFSDGDWKCFDKPTCP